MKVILKKAVYSNFKGISRFVLEPSEETTNIYGDNGVGKTTLRDGYLWCLTGRDSMDRFNHEIKPLDKEGKPIHNLESYVQLYLKKGDKEYNLKRVFKEVWSRKNGESEKTFDNNTTDFYVNDVKVTSKTQYELTVGEIFNKDLVQLLSDPSYFVGLKWQNQREQLFSLINITDKDVESSNKELAGFSTKYNTSMLDVEKKSLNSKKRELSKDIQDSEAKREENLNSLGEPQDWSKLEKEVKLKEKELANIDKLIEDEFERNKASEEAKNKEYLEKYNKLNESLVDTKKLLNDKLADSRVEYDKELDKLKRELIKLEREREALIDENKSNKEYNSRVEDNLKDLSKRREVLLEEYKLINGRVLSVDSICPTCGAIRGDIETYKKQIEEQFNKRKAEDLEANVRDGKYVASKIKELKGSIKPIVDIKEITKQVAAAQHKMDMYPSFNKPKEVEYLEEKVASILEALDRLSKPSSTVSDATGVNALREKKDAIRADIKELELGLYGKKQFEQKQERIAELEKSIKATSLELARLDGEIYLIDLFERTKNALCESLINAKFKVVQFSLFEYLNDGTPKPNCQALFNGVPTSTLNTGGVINVGLDVIRTFSEYFGESYPVFIDNKESVTKTIHIDSQTIMLSVKEGQKELLIENK